MSRVPTYGLTGSTRERRVQPETHGKKETETSSEVRRRHASRFIRH